MGRKTITPCNILDPFLEIPSKCELNDESDRFRKDAKFNVAPLENLPLYSLRLPTWFMMDTLMSETIIDAAPLSYHIKLFRGLKKIIKKSEINMAMGKTCIDDSDCENNECVIYDDSDSGFCKKSYSSAYNAIDGECSNPSLSAYMFNECFRLGSLFGDTSDKFIGCIDDLKNYMVLSYLKGVDQRIDIGMKRWLDTSNSLMRYGMLEDPESNDFSIEGTPCTTDYHCYYNNEITKDCSDYDDTMLCDDKKGRIHNGEEYVYDYSSELLESSYSHNHFYCEFENSDYFAGTCRAKTPKLHLNTAIKDYVDILNYILTPGEDDPMRKMLSFSCKDINRYNYSDICETAKKSLEENIDKVINKLNQKLTKKMEHYLEPITRFMAKVKYLYKKYKTPDALLSIAYCSKETSLNACFNSCKADIVNDGTSIQVSNPTCDPTKCGERNLIQSGCNSSTVVREIVLKNMGLMSDTKELLFSDKFTISDDFLKMVIQFFYLTLYHILLFGLNQKRVT